jgi:hypothetical protein
MNFLLTLLSGNPIASAQAGKHYFFLLVIIAIGSVIFKKMGKRKEG